jgi:hypothetical protein
MSAPSITKRAPRHHRPWSPTGNGTAWRKPTDQQATTPTKSSLGPLYERSTVPQMLPAKARQLFPSRQPTAKILTAAVKSP